MSSASNHPSFKASFGQEPRRLRTDPPAAGHDVLSTLIEHAPFGIAFVDAQLCVRAVNKRAAGVFGDIDARRGRDIGEIVRGLWPETVAADALDRLRRTLATGEPSIVAGEWQAKRIAMPDGTLALVCYVGDPLLSHDTEVHLRDSEARLRLALDASGMGTFVWHLEDDRSEPDTRMLALFGVAPAGTRSVSDALRHSIHPDDRERYGAAVARATDPAGPGVLHEEIRVRHADGAERWLAISGQTVFDSADQPAFKIGARRALRMSGMAVDITEQKRREANRNFLADLSGDLGRLASADEIMQAVGEKVGAYLDVSASCLVEFDENVDEARLTQIWRAEGQPPLPERIRLSSFVTEDFHRASRTGEAVVVRDAATDPRVVAGACAALQINAIVSVPLIRGGSLKLLLAVCDARPRHWREDEIRLCRELAIRLLPRLERARAEEILANDLRDTRLLRDLSVRLVSEADEHLFFDAIIAAAVDITDANAGSIHLLDPETNDVVLLATQGLGRQMTQHFSRLDIASQSPDGTALTLGQRTYVDFDDSRTAADLDASMPLHLGAGLRSAMSTPLVTRAGRTIGMLSTYWADRRRLSERELRFLDLLARQAADLIERRRTDDALRESEHRLSAELADTKLLQGLSAQLIEEQGSMSLYETIADAAKSIMRSTYSSLQMLHPDRGSGGELQLIASRGLNDEAKTYWEWVTTSSTSTCGAALRQGVRVIAPDIEGCDFMIGTKDQAAMLAGGLRSAQSTPLLSRSGRMLGMISTHWDEPHQPSERDLRLLDILARQAADLMEHTQAEETLRRNESDLKEADRRKDEFLAVLAHELRNPLAPLRTGLELIRLSGDTPGAVEEVRAMMEEQVGHMVRLIDDLLDVSRITSGKIRLQRQATPLHAVVNAAVAENQAALGAGQVALSIDLPATPVVLDVDPTRAVQVLSNILHNAVKFTQPGGRIRIAAELADSASVVVVISDTGVGISKELLPRVFDLFTQEEGAGHGSDAGLGIGLALARQLVEMHGGAIEIGSDGPGLGSTVTVRLPVSAETSKSRSSVPLPIARIARRVVVIDDNAPAANALERLVMSIGGECRVAHDGERGIAEVLAFRPDLVFLDIGMPGMDGYETCRRIRRQVGPDVYLVALTGWGQDRDREEATRAGFDMHLAKPADPIVLERLLMTAPTSPRRERKARK